MWRRTLGCIVTFTLSLLVAPLVAEAQPTGKIYRIGRLHEGVRPVSSAFLEAMRLLGYVEGDNLFFEHRHAATREQLPALAAELVAHQVDLIATLGTPATQAAQQATTTIPIVFSLANDPVQNGLVASYAQPGGNLTGIVAGLYDDKQLAILKEAVPGIVRVACLCPRPENAARAAIIDAARRLGLEILDIAVSGPEDFDRFFAEAHRGGADAVFVHNHAWLLPHLTRLGELAAQNRLPAIGYRRQFAEAGGLLSYASVGEEYVPRIAATYMDKLLRGAKPGDLPVHQLMQFELVINLKVAQALGLTIPPSFLFQANEVMR
jgi:putative tryptophan/tyrosine transport system substrate-binding protein